MEDKTRCMIDFRYIDAFFQVASHQNFGQAAKELCISPSAVSRQIRLLEESIGEQLLIRSPHHVSLTEKGSELLASTQKYLGSLEQVFETEKQVTLRIGVLEGVMQNWLADKVASMAAKQTWNFDILVGQPDHLMQALTENKLDIIFYSYANQTHCPDTVKNFKVLKEEIVLISTDKVDLERVEDYPWVVFDNNTWLTRFTKKRPAQLIQVNNMAGIIELVRKGAGVAMVPAHVLRADHGLKVQTVPKYRREWIFGGYLKQRWVPTHLQEFLSAIQDS